jgi:hypothetical protein
MHRTTNNGGRGLVFALTLFLTLTASASYAALNVDTLRQMVEAGRSEAAYRLAEPHVTDYEGDPTFDFYYGLAAIDSGHVSRGVLALERVLMAKPTNLRVRLELARGYYLLHEDTRARKEFERVLAQNPPTKVRENIQRFLDAIRLREARYRTTAGAYVELDVGYDTNVNSGPGSRDVSFPNLPDDFTLRLDKTAVEAEDSFSTLYAGAQVNHPVAPGTAVFATVDGWGRHNSDYDQFDTGLVSAQVGASWRRDRNVYRLSALGQSFAVDNSAYRNLYGATVEWRQSTPQGDFTSSFSYTKLNYPDQEPRDSSQYTLSLGLLKQLPGDYQPLLFVNLIGGREIADDKQFRNIADRDIIGARLGSQFRLTPRVSLTPSLFAQASNYHGVLLTARREDLYTALDLQLNWLLARHWSARANVNYAQNDSNFEMYTYDRTQSSVGLRYEY